MEPEEEYFQQDVKFLEELQDRMLKAGLVVGHGYSENPKLIGAEFTPDGQEVVTTIYALNDALGPLTPKQIVLFWRYMVRIAEERQKS